MRILSLTFVLFLTAAPAVAQPATQPARPADRMPLIIDSSGTLPPAKDKVPMLVVIGSGTLDRPRRVPAPQLPRFATISPACPDDLITSLSEGIQKLAGAREGQENWLFVQSPPLGPGQEFVPVSLILALNRLELTADVWAGSEVYPPTKPFIGERCGYLFPLPQLKAGTYRFALRIRRMDSLRNAGGDRWTLGDISQATMELNVSGAEDKDMRDAATVSADQLKSEPLAQEGDPARFWQKPLRIATSVMDARRLVALGLAVGTFDADAWLKKGAADFPSLENKPGEPVYATILGPTLNSGEWMSLREIVWTGRSCELHVEVWRDDGDRAKNIIFNPVLVVPLGKLPAIAQDGKADAGEFTIRVVWTGLRAPEMRGLYSPNAKDTEELGKLPSEVKVK